MPARAPLAQEYDGCDVVYDILDIKYVLTYLMSSKADSPLTFWYPMSWLECATLVHALRAVLIYSWFLNRQSGYLASGALDGPEGLMLLGWEVLLLIIVTVVAGIIIQIVAVILATATGQESIAGIEDERDRLIEARAMVRGFTFVGFGFLAAILALWQGWGAVWAFNLMLAGMVASDIVVNLLKFLRYARGI